MSNIKQFFDREDVQSKFREMLGKRAPQFITSVLQIVSNNEMLKDADAVSIYNSAAVAATLDLPLNNNLGFAYIVPYNQKQPDKTYKKVAQFQMGYKGFVQLAQRSGQFLTINAKAVCEGQLIEDDSFEGYHFDWKLKKSDTVIGFAAYFKLLNGFEKTHFMTVDELKKHGVKYSQTFKKGFGLWKDDFEAMAIKTVIKLLLSKYAPLSVQMQAAVISDQSIINNSDATDVTYVDNTEVAIDKEKERVALMIEDAKDLKELEALQEYVKEDQFDLFNQKKEALTK